MLRIGWNKSAKAPSPEYMNLNLGKGFWYESTGGAKTIGFTQNYSID